jgi:hypothetical protein
MVDILRGAMPSVLGRLPELLLNSAALSIANGDN